MHCALKQHQTTSGYNSIPKAIAEDETAAVQVPLGTPPSKGMKTTQKKGDRVMRRSTVFGTFTVVLVGVVVLLFICGSWW